MQSSSESEVRTPRLFLTKSGACFLTPNLLSADPEIDTPNKIPAAPHPSPINMDIGQLNPESKETFRKQLLKACQLKIPEAIENTSSFGDGMMENVSFAEVSDPACKLIFRNSDREELGNVLSEIKFCQPPEIDDNVKVNEIFDDDRYENLNYKALLANDDHDIKFNYEFVKNEKNLSGISQIEDVENLDVQEFSDAKVIKKYSGDCKISTHIRSNFKHPNCDANPDYTNLPQIKAEFIAFPLVLQSDLLASIDPVNDVKRQSSFLDSMPSQVFYDPLTNRIDLPLPLEPNNEWDDSSSYRSRSPCSDKLSTVAHCASEASDISDFGDFEEDLGSSSKDFECSTEIRSKSFGSSKEFHSKSFGSSKDLGSTKECRPKKKSSDNVVIRRFLRWRRGFKLRKRAESLDESKFPFLANRIDSYKTEFELSV